MGLERDEAIDHLHAGAFQIAGPFDVGGLVEAGLQFDQGGDRLARFRRFDQSLHDGAVLELVRYSVCLIATTSGSAAAWRRNCTTVSKLSNGMMDDQVLFPDRGEAIAAMVADALRERAHYRA